MAATDEMNGGDVRPRPDPTDRTEERIKLAERTVREWVGSQLEVRDERILGIDRATELRRSDILAIPVQINEAVRHLADLTDERFNAVERQRVEQKKDTKDAVDAALSAAKEAVKEQTTASQLATAKSDAATSAQLQQQQQTFATAIDGLRRSIEEVKERAADDNRNLRQDISNVATVANGTVQQKVGAKDDRQAVYAAIGVILALIAFVAGKGF